ncbi:MAG: spore coat U domain-containing protein [Xanthobacteraceae bacterium]|nr:spore coat U domain-containing protein [Xanthobacteraceae bacterium]
MFVKTIVRLATRGLLQAFLLSLSSVAWGQSCTFSISNVEFSNINTAANVTYNTTATLTANCTGLASRTVRVCPNIGSGTGGTANGNPRYMLSAGYQLAYNLFSNSNRTIVWGSHVWPYSYNPPTININLNSSGTGSTSRTIYARVFAGQQLVPAGTYTSAFSGGHTLISYAYSTVGNCQTIGGMNGTTTPFIVNASNQPNCTVSASTLDFGAAGSLTGVLDAVGSISLTCTLSTPYVISLNGGNDGAIDPTLRKMSKGAEKITYGLYRDTARLLPWGATTGLNTVAGTGTGAAQSLQVYGRVPSQTTPSAGIYTDTIVVTVTY